MTRESDHQAQGHTTRRSVARKVHRCEACAQPIAPGTSYLYVKESRSPITGEHTEHKYCRLCGWLNR